MASADGPTPDHLSFLRGEAALPKAWGFLALLRRAEALAPSLPRIGRSRLPSQNVADLAQTPSLAFQPPRWRRSRPVRRVASGCGACSSG